MCRWTLSRLRIPGSLSNERQPHARLSSPTTLRTTSPASSSSGLPADRRRLCYWAIYGFKQPVVRVKGMIVLRPPNDITVVPVSMDRGRRIVGPAAPPPVWRVAISVPTVRFDDGTMLGVDRYELVRTITARTELPAALAAAEKRWAEKKPDVYEFTFKQICFCVPPPPQSGGFGSRTRLISMLS